MWHYAISIVCELWEWYCCTQAAGGDGTRRTAVHALSAAQRRLLGDWRRELPAPPRAVELPVRALRDTIDWAHAQHEYATARLVVIDDLLDTRALAELQVCVRLDARRPRVFSELRATHILFFTLAVDLFLLLLFADDRRTQCMAHIFAPCDAASWAPSRATV